MNLEYFITKRIAFSNGHAFSGFIVKIAVAAIALSMTVMVVTTATVNGFQNEISKKIFGFWGHINITHMHPNRSLEDITPISKQQHFYPHIDTLEEVSHIQVFANKAGIIKTDTDIEGVVMKGIGSDFDWRFFKEYIVDGEPFTVTDSTKSNNIVISQTIANRLRLKVGEKMVIYFVQDPPRVRKLKITGIYKTGLEEYDEKYALIDLKHIQKLNKWEKEQVGGFEIFLNHIHQRSAWRDLLSGMTFYLWDYLATIITNLSYEWNLVYGTPALNLTAPDRLTQLANQIHLSTPHELNTRTIKELYTNIFEWLQLQDINRLVILVLMALVGIINMITVLLILILERTNMIGILKALGANNWTVRKIFLYNAAFIVGLGLLIGNAIGLGLCYLQKHFEFIQLPEESYYISVAPMDINLWVLLGLNIGTLLICLLMLIIPSYLVSRIDPIKAIRFN